MDCNALRQIANEKQSEVAKTQFVLVVVRDVFHQSEIESKKVRNEEEIRKQAKHDVQKVITCRNQIAKPNPSKVVTIYMGQTINGLVRCYDHDDHPIKSGYIHRELIGKTADVKEGS
ncbi:hypothetical protein PVAND_007899 [Polypedilum vanderplanki]|uniref:Uncharacterized protein n=1 Tax=Polypedilum vanderplanki TaxID=319348 RepID=A0A9J6C8A2_POLVA|nr:hypothetical protein PVAND_007899 [Polypedilum vanderplanki]